MPIVETKINRFDGGITNDPRNPAGNVGRVVSNFDVITNPYKMTPYRSSESGDDAPTTSIKRNFCVALRDVSASPDVYSLYSLGVVSGTGRAEILYKNLTTGATTDLDDNSWTNTANNQSGAGAASFNLFVFYRRTGYIYWGDSNTIGRYDPDGTDAIAQSHQALTYTRIGQGIVHSKDDILYIPYYDEAGPTAGIARNNNGSWNNTALTLPTHYVPTSICEYGNYLAIGCAHVDGVSNSRIFLWDRDSTLTTVSESIDAGTGSLIILEEIDGELVWISQKGGAGTSFSGIPHGTSSHRDRVIFRRLVGSTGVKFFELQANHAGSANTTQLPLYKQKIDNRLYFQMLIELNGSVRDGVWSIGRSGQGQPFSLVHERTSNNDTALATSATLRGFFQVGDYLFQSYVSGGSHNTTKTDDGSTFSHNSIYETKTFATEDPSYYKDLVEVSVQTEYMPTAGQVTLAYQTNQNVGTSTWTTIFTNSTDNSVSHTAQNIESSGAQLPKQYKQIAFRILSTGGAEVTGLIFKESVTVRKHIAD